MHYDYIIAGGGAAGLSLACHILQSPLRDCTMLIIDKDDDDQLRRNWGYWTQSSRPTLFDPVEHHTWNRLEFCCGNTVQRIDLGTYQYRLMHGAHFYRYALEQLAECPRVNFTRGVIRTIEDGAQSARVVVGAETFTANWVFNSVLKPAELKRRPRRQPLLLMQFKGWEIETAQPAFDPGVARWMDFRTPQAGQMRFFYVMPYSATHALVEFTAFTASILTQETYTTALGAYLAQALGIHDYRILHEENGAVPLSATALPRREGARVMAIGARGGRIKPSTGYSFMRIQDDSQSIVRQLLLTGQPFGVPRSPAFFRLCDGLLLRSMRRHGEQIAPIFAAMFNHNPIQGILRFLDENSTPLETLRLVSSLPIGKFFMSLL